MDETYAPYHVYKPVAKKLMRLLLPYEECLATIVKQPDSFCLYTKAQKGKDAVLFAAVQIVKNGVAFTVYNPDRHTDIFNYLPKQLKRSYQGSNRFLITKVSAELIRECQELLSALFGLYHLGKFYHAYNQ